MSVSPYNSGPRLLDIMDTSIFDFLIGKNSKVYVFLVHCKTRQHFMCICKGPLWSNRKKMCKCHCIRHLSIVSYSLFGGFTQPPKRNCQNPLISLQEIQYERLIYLSVKWDDPQSVTFILKKRWTECDLSLGNSKITISIKLCWSPFNHREPRNNWQTQNINCTNFLE